MIVKIEAVQIHSKLFNETDTYQKVDEWSIDFEEESFYIHHTQDNRIKLTLQGNDAAVKLNDEILDAAVQGRLAEYEDDHYEILIACSFYSYGD